MITKTFFFHLKKLKTEEVFQIQAWNAEDRNAFINKWYNLWPLVIFFVDVNESELEDFKIFKAKKINSDLLDYAKGLSCLET